MKLRALPLSSTSGEVTLLPSLMIVPVPAIGLAGNAMAQQPSNMHYYLGMFKYADNAIKAMMENPQDRSAATRKVIEGLGGKIDGIYRYATRGDWDGIIIAKFPDSVIAGYMTVQAIGNFQAVIPLVTPDQFKAAMEKAQQAKTGYTPPTMTK
jgi:uncharacterized protein with GYD domain